MKILFTIAVLIAGVYLFLPQNKLNKFAFFLPQHQIEQATDTVLSDVDQKLEQFKSKFVTSKNSRMSELEKQLASLKTKVIAQEEKYKLLVLENKKQALLAQKVSAQTLPEQILPAQKKAAPTQYITSKPSSTNINTNGPQPLISANSSIGIEMSDKEQAIFMQAYLQDLAERMDQTSLLSLTK